MLLQQNGDGIIQAAPTVFGPSVLDERATTDETAVLQVTIAHDGRLTIRGPRAAVMELMACCARYGFVIELDYLNWCG